MTPCKQYGAAALLVACALSAATALAAGPDVEMYTVNTSGDVQATGRGGGTMQNHPQTEAAAQKIKYHGGPVILGTVHAYVIWYGNWTGNTATTIIPDFLSSIGGSPYYNINTTYGQLVSGVPTRCSNSVSYGGSTTDNYSRGSNLTDTNIQQIVSDAINQARLPKDDHGVYFVLTSADVTELSGYCTVYCGWHTVGTISGTRIKYSFVGNPDRCISSCAAQSVGPNGNAGADGMVNVIAHELEESHTDPELNAWYDALGAENADKCAWTFGQTYMVNGAQANMHVGTRDYLIQQNWNAGQNQHCGLQYP